MCGSFRDSVSTTITRHTKALIPRRGFTINTTSRGGMCGFRKFEGDLVDRILPRSTNTTVCQRHAKTVQCDHKVSDFLLCSVGYVYKMIADTFRNL